LTVTASVDVLAEGLSGANVPLLRLFDPSGVRLLSLYRQNKSTNSIWVTDSSTRYATTGKLPLGTWAQVEVHTITAGPGASTLDVRLNGSSIFQSSSSSLGSTGVLTLQVGNDTAAQPFTLVADDVSAHA
jgi:hypothetical protein